MFGLIGPETKKSEITQNKKPELFSFIFTTISEIQNDGKTA
jgi:hypothetical protein